MDQAEKTLQAFRRAMLWNNPEKFQKHMDLSEAESEDMADATLCYGAVVGSWNYGLQHEGSDVDLKLAYWPTFEQYFDAKFYNVRSTSPEVDFHLVPVHKLFQALLRGNSGYYEMLFPLKEGYRWCKQDLGDDSDYGRAFCDPLDHLLESAKYLVHGNAKGVVHANLGSARQAWCRSQSKVTDRWAKESAKAYRFVNTVYVYLTDGRLTGFRDEDSNKFQRSVLNGEVGKEEFDELYDNLLDEVCRWMESSLQELDKTETEEYQRALRDYKWDLMTAVKDHTIDM